MPRNLARYEQFLRLHALVETLASSRQPIDDATIIVLVKERLGLARLSPRTLHRDCEFLVGCGYPLDRVTLQGPRRNGWSLDREAVNRLFPTATTLTVLELTAFGLARDLLRTFEGTVVWSGIESLRAKLDGVTPRGLQRRLDAAGKVFQVEHDGQKRLADHPRMLSGLATAIVEHRVIDVDHQVDGQIVSATLEPVRLLIRSPSIELVARQRSAAVEDRPMTIDLANIRRVTLRDETFVDPTSPAAEADGEADGEAHLA